MQPVITSLQGNSVLDSRGIPSVECTCILSDGTISTASVPSGASTGAEEAIELRDQDADHYLGKSVNQAINNITAVIAPQLSGANPLDQESIDHTLIELDGTSNKSRLGANGILAVSIAVARAASLVKHVPFYQHLADLAHNDLQFHIPIPLANVLNGGLHAGMNLDFQEFMLAPNAQNLKEYPEQLETIAECYQHLKRIISAMNQPTTVGDEGGFAPKLRTNRGALKLLTEAIKLADFTYKDHIYISLDIAANSFFHQGQYQVKDFDHPLSPTEYTAYIDNLVAEYDPLSIEDPFHEDDWSAWATFTNKHDQKCMIVGDDILVTHKDRLKRAIKEHTCNTILLKPNQVGTLSEAIEVATLAKAHHFYTIASHRSGETTDTFIADFAVGLGTDFTKFGAPARGERVAKYNRLLEIYREISH